MSEQENLVFDPAVAQRLSTPEEIRNYVAERTDRYRALIASMPPPSTDEITSLAYLRWERRCMMAHGRAVESICFAQVFGMITPEEFIEFKNRLIATTLITVSNVQLGKR